MKDLKLHWLDKTPTQAAGVSWGVPWKKGILNREDPLALVGPSGKKISLQSWPLAYWPDGSVKWTGHAAVMQEYSKGAYTLNIDDNKRVEHPLRVRESDEKIEVNTGPLQCNINKSGHSILNNLVVNENMLGTKGKLISIREERNERSEEGTIYRHERLEGKINAVEIEQTGPIRAVIKITGVHVNETKEWLPFVLRMYFYYASPEIKMVHTFIYDGDPRYDFVKGLGIEFQTNIQGEPWNRIVRFLCEEGIYSEPGQLVWTRTYGKADGLYEKQISGEPVNVTEHPTLKDHVQGNAVWNDFKIVQDSSFHYKVRKRTEENCAWLDAVHGSKAKGLMYAGGSNGGIAVGLKNFWEKNPSALEINQFTKEMPTMMVWFWSPEGEAMDLRHYSNDTHVCSAYEGFDEMRSTPHGVANTSEVNLRGFSKAPVNEELLRLGEDWQNPTLLLCESKYYHSTYALGTWSLPDYEDPFKAALETQLEAAFSFYKQEVEQRSWYGYWNYGDVMHTYDSTRHQWLYDEGGFAWQNTELVPNIWLWYAFLRTGRKDIFEMAEAMTRHTSEVDRYHIGEYAGLGSRHNVIHWGCGCKEARISMASLHKYYYFLTTDERTRDLLADVRDVDYATMELDPMRAFYPSENGVTHTRVGPDWSAFCSNWLSEWERTENTTYKEKIETGIDNLKNTPNRLLSGPVFEYDARSSNLYHIGDGTPGGYHMVIAFGAPQVWMEAAELLEDDEWKEMLAEFGEFYLLTDEEKRKRSKGKITDKMFDWPMFAAGMAAYAASQKQDDNLAQKVWQLLLKVEYSHIPLPIEKETIKTWKTLNEIPWVTTNTISQWCLNVIVALELIGDTAPEADLQKSIIHQKSITK
ncbi:hypothetical protein D7Z54_01295 [Salibacterium salarium]|uniref:Tat pathway signal sequence domain protein n=1 Tax=Salibacterium salarium TaxID=284579 RepID=A0A428NAI5_9BACI|nr:hypothetical protein [Salibacterium salarium]RSL35419.1 hypothetical protein D7Z54_01295 [Salibacterium salarium]